MPGRAHNLIRFEDPNGEALKTLRLLAGIVVRLRCRAGCRRDHPQSDPASRRRGAFQDSGAGRRVARPQEALARTRFPEELPGAAWDYGTDINYLKSLVAYWRDRYDWRAQERRLNQFDQFTTEIDG
jgi:hypothetical protein